MENERKEEREKDESRIQASKINFFCSIIQNTERDKIKDDEIRYTPNMDKFSGYFEKQ